MDAKLREYGDWARLELDRCVDFWLTYGMDHVNGGVYTCLDRSGGIYSTDKSVWMQGRCAWTFAYLCNTYGARPEWLEASESCLEFMEKYCINREKGNRMYFTVTAEGKPLRQRRYCFSEGFYCMANAEYYLATGEPERLVRAKAAYELVWNLNRGLIDDPVGMGPKTIAETRSGRALADPMIYLNLSSVMRRCDPQNSALYDERSEICVHDIFAYHHKPELRATLESVGPEGEFMGDVTQGRVVSPGHDIECSWFVMEYALYKHDEALMRRAMDIFDFAIEAGWDDEYEGLLYFVDCLKKPTEAYEHDMKLWWPHNEVLIAALMAYKHTGCGKYLNWFTRTADYCKRVFADPKYGEWYGYLRRDGKPTQPPTKGSTFKGPFHLPRMLIMTERMINGQGSAK